MIELVVDTPARSQISKLDALEWTVARYLPGLMTLLVYVFLFVPLGVLVVYSFNDSNSTVTWGGLTIRWYESLLSSTAILRSLQTSALAAIASGLVSTTIGTLGALAMVRFTFRGKDFLASLMMAPLVVPEIVLAVAFLVMMVFMRVELGLATIVAGHTLIITPYAFLTVRAAAASLDRRLEEAAADLGADEWRTLYRVTLPLLLPAVGTAFLLTATLSFDNFVMSVFTSGVGTTPLPVRIYSMLKLGITPQINALGTVLIVINVTVLALVIGRSVRSMMLAK